MTKGIVRKLSFSRKHKKKDIPDVMTDDESRILCTLNKFVNASVTPPEQREELHKAISILSEITEVGQISPGLRKEMRNCLSTVDKTKISDDQKIAYANFATFT